MTSCLDWFNAGARKNGEYTILYKQMSSYRVFCDFESEKNSTWTLVMSYALKHKGEFQIGLNKNTEVNEESPNWEGYR